MGTVLTCECGDKELTNGQNTPPYIVEHDEEFIKMRGSATTEKYCSWRKLESQRNSISPIQRSRNMTELRLRERESIESRTGFNLRNNSIGLRGGANHEGNSSMGNPFLNTDRGHRTSVTTPRSVRSSEFTQDHELVYQIFDDLKTEKTNKNYKAIARSLIGLVDLLRDITINKDEYDNYDAA